jgi:hypothetical protein
VREQEEAECRLRVIIWKFSSPQNRGAPQHSLQRLEFQAGDGSSRTQGRVFIELVRAGFAAAEKVSSTVTLCTDAAGNFSLTAHIGSR